jgi:hypothetical protein
MYIYSERFSSLSLSPLMAERGIMESKRKIN